jgi:hypothetical protein
MNGMTNAHRALVGKHQEREYLEDKRRWEDVTKLCVRRGRSYWLDLTQENDKCCALVNTAVHLSQGISRLIIKILKKDSTQLVRV